MTREGVPNRLSHARASKCAIRFIKHALVSSLFSVITVCMMPAWSGAEELAPKGPGAAEDGDQCALVVSPDHRLTVERWARDGQCERPVRTRVIDRFLGFACLQNASESSTCRSFAPPLGRYVLDAPQFFHCVEVFVTDADAGIAITRMRQWVGSGKGCDWSPSLEAPVMEVDFRQREVCAGGLCIPADRLSISGKIRLRRLIETAFRQLGIDSSQERWGPLPMRPAKISEPRGFFAAIPASVEREPRP